MANVPLNKFNRPATFDESQTETKYEMFVDDALSACIRNKAKIQQMVCASVEALYMLSLIQTSVPTNPPSLSLAVYSSNH